MTLPCTSRRAARALVIAIAIAAAIVAASSVGCDARPESDVVFDNRFPPSAPSRVVYRAFWHSVSFTDAIAPGASSDPQPVVPASANLAYVVLAPGWDPDAGPPTSLVVLQSRQPFDLALDAVLHVPVDDATFEGDCAAGSHLTQAQADFVTRRVFAAEFAGLAYDPATCTVTALADGGTDAGLDAGGDSGIDGDARDD